MPVITLVKHAQKMAEVMTECKIVVLETATLTKRYGVTGRHPIHVTVIERRFYDLHDHSNQKMLTEVHVSQ